MKYFKTEYLRENGSGIVYLKSRFFIYRIIGYFSFLLIPVWVTKTFHLNHGQLCLMMTLYIIFMMGQWFLLGKEIDHFLNIYFKINSSIDRTIYRLFLGLIFFIIYFNLLSFLPNKWIYNCFWITWVILGLFYSWPTRGKIIQESISTDFNEFRYLDSFEKTLLILTSVIYFFSVPEISLFTNIDAFKLFLDPLEKDQFPILEFSDGQLLSLQKISPPFKNGLDHAFLFSRNGTVSRRFLRFIATFFL